MGFSGGLGLESRVFGRARGHEQLRGGQVPGAALRTDCLHGDPQVFQVDQIHDDGGGKGLP